MQRSRLRTTLAVGALALVWFSFGPRNLGGGVDYVVVARGNSMQPTLEIGDLVVTKPASSYAVGDIVAVRGLDGPVVVHRIIAIDEAGIRTRGDANGFTDPDPVSAEQIVGRMAFRVPAVGRWMGAFGRGGLMGVIVALLVFLVGLGYLRETQPKRETQSKQEKRGDAAPSWRPADASTLQHAAVGLVLGGIVVAVIGFSAPERKPGPVSIDHVATSMTGGPAPKGPVYPEGVVPDGQPFYLNLVEQARVRVSVAASQADRAIPVTGTWKMTALLSSSAGWERAFPMGAGDLTEGSAHGRLDLVAMRQVLEGFKNATGDNEGFYPVTVRSALEISGSVAGVAYTRPMVTELKMRFDGERFFHDTTAEPVGATMTADVLVPDAAAGSFGILGRELPTRALRIVAALLILGGAVAALGSLLMPEPISVARRRKLDAITNGHGG